jgi:hypothetical protein
MPQTNPANMNCTSIITRTDIRFTVCLLSYVRDFEGADIRVNGETLIHAHNYEQMPAESQFEETIYVMRNTNKYSFDFKLGFRSQCEHGK